MPLLPKFSDLFKTYPLGQQQIQQHIPKTILYLSLNLFYFTYNKTIECGSKFTLICGTAKPYHLLWSNNYSSYDMLDDMGKVLSKPLCP